MAALGEIEKSEDGVTLALVLPFQGYTNQRTLRHMMFHEEIFTERMVKVRNMPMSSVSNMFHTNTVFFFRDE